MHLFGRQVPKPRIGPKVDRISHLTTKNGLRNGQQIAEATVWLFLTNVITRIIIYVISALGIHPILESSLEGNDGQQQNRAS
jgi:hypothetical protein